MGAGHEPARCQPPAKGRDPSRVPPEHTASNTLYEPWCYNAHMAGVVTAKVSQRGQTSLPAELRHRWGIADGGDVVFIDLGDAALILPGGTEAAKAEVRRALAGGAYAEGLAAIDDPDLAP